MGGRASRWRPERTMAHPPSPCQPLPVPLGKGVSLLLGDQAAPGRRRLATPADRDPDSRTGCPQLAGSCRGREAGPRTPSLGPRVGSLGGDAPSAGPGAVPSWAPSFSAATGDGAHQCCPLDFFLLPN